MPRKKASITQQMALFLFPFAAPKVGWAPDAPTIDMQWLAIKRQHPDALIFFRLGDFYEAFDTDAIAAVQVLGIASIHIPWGDDGRVAMAGVPCQAIQRYVDTLTARGYRVILVDQMAESEATS